MPDLQEESGSEILPEAEARSKFVVSGLIDMPTPRKVMVLGDTHHNLEFVASAIDSATRDSVDAIIQIGDFGVWPSRNDEFLNGVGGLLQRTGIQFYWLDGNHEDLSYIKPGMRIGPLQHLPRGFRWQWWDKTWMSVGGGVSVDKRWRTPGVDWFPEETLSLEEAEYCARPGPVDIVLSHDCPDQVEMPGLGEHAGWYPADAIRESEEHRAVLGGICDALRPELLVHGHYHIAHTTTRESSDTKIIGLDRDGTSLTRSTHLLMPELVLEP